MSNEAREFVSRGGLKLQAALDAFELDVTGLLCADFGCNVGGFTDCLLRRGVSKVYAVDTGYGELAWTLRRDGRVVVMERTNALHCAPPEPVDLVVADVAWTPQSRVIPAALAWLKPGGRIVSLLKPHYELTKLAGRKPIAPLDPTQSDDVCRQVCQRLADFDCRVLAVTRSTILGKGGNVEFLLLIAPGSSLPAAADVQ
jgi:23S rRNA (cytidine1920-2'-O)/16S rRNA (cytidine1409-2'-O)-methyltransferase